MNINEMTIGEAKELAAMFGGAVNVKGTGDFELLTNYLIRTVTFTAVGKVVEESDKFLTLECASWVADTGRFNECLKTGKFNEVEPFVRPALIALGAIVDATPWPHLLPTEVK